MNIELLDFIKELGTFTRKINSVVFDKDLTEAQKVLLNSKEIFDSKRRVIRDEFEKEFDNATFYGTGVVNQVYLLEDVTLPKEYQSFFRKKGTVAEIHLDFPKIREKFKNDIIRDVSEFKIKLYTNNISEITNLNKGILKTFKGILPEKSNEQWNVNYKRSLGVLLYCLEEERKLHPTQTLELIEI